MTTATVKCPSCGAENGEGQYCMTCGAPLSDTRASQARQLSSATEGKVVPAPVTAPPVQSTNQPTSWAAGQQQQLTSMGALVDSWADLLDDMGDKANTVMSEFRQRMNQRQIPNVKFEAADITASSIGGASRSYNLVKTTTGATIAVRVDRFGRDLFLSWDLWVRPLPNWPVIVAVLGAAAFMALGGARTPAFFGQPQFNLVLWLLGTIFNCLWIGFLIGLAGKIIHGSWLHFYIKQLTPFDTDDITAMSLAVHHSLLQSADVAGINAQLIRPKGEFRGGQRNRLI